VKLLEERILPLMKKQFFALQSQLPKKDEWVYQHINVTSTTSCYADRGTVNSATVTRRRS
jgi:hypothetical protein